MSVSPKDEARDLKRVLEKIGTKEECMMCRFVLIFSLAVLLSVILLVYLLRSDAPGAPTPDANNTASFHSLPINPKTFASSAPEFNQRILELGQTANRSEIKKAGSTTRTSSADNGEMMGVTSASAKPSNVPDGPPPVLPP